MSLPEYQSRSTQTVSLTAYFLTCLLRLANESDTRGKPLRFPGVRICVLQVGAGDRALPRRFRPLARERGPRRGTAGSHTSREPGHTGAKYANVEDGWTGIAFIETCLKSSKKNGAWTAMPKTV